MNNISPRGRENLWVGSLMKKNIGKRHKKRHEEEVLVKETTTTLNTHFE